MNRTSGAAGSQTALMVVADTAAAASIGVDEGADLIDLTGAVPAEVAAFRQAHPRRPGLRGRGHGRVRRSGGPDQGPGRRGRQRRPADLRPPGRSRTVRPAAGAAADRDLPAGLGGRRSQAAAPRPRGPDRHQHQRWARPDVPDSGTSRARPRYRGDGPPGAAALAAAALSGWLGAAVVRTLHPQPVRRALDLTDSVRGVRPPARTVRGLA